MTWLIHVCALAHSFVCPGSFICLGATGTSTEILSRTGTTLNMQSAVGTAKQVMVQSLFLMGTAALYTVCSTGLR